MGVVDDVAEWLRENPEGGTFAELRAELEVGHTALDQALTRLEREELIEQLDDGTYRRQLTRPERESAPPVESSGTTADPPEDDSEPEPPRPPGGMSAVDAYYEAGKADQVFVSVDARGEMMMFGAPDEEAAAKKVFDDTGTEDGQAIALASLAQMGRWRYKRTLERDDGSDADLLHFDEFDEEDPNAVEVTVQCTNTDCDNSGFAWQVKATRDGDGDWALPAGSRECATCEKRADITPESLEKLAERDKLFAESDADAVIDDASEAKTTVHELPDVPGAEAVTAELTVEE